MPGSAVVEVIVPSWSMGFSEVVWSRVMRVKLARDFEASYTPATEKKTGTRSGDRGVHLGKAPGVPMVQTSSLLLRVPPNPRMVTDLRDQRQASLGDAYRLDRELGGGGMSRVFVAQEGALDRRVVVKVLPPELTGSLSIERFRREIQLAARVHHPHIVPVLLVGQADGLLYYTMPYIEGESLRKRLDREGTLPVADVIRIMRDVADALGHAHALGVVHRDIKPDNILLVRHHALLTDFGVAKALHHSLHAGERHGRVRTPSTGMALGTPAYMAPEQAG